MLTWNDLSDEVQARLIEWLNCEPEGEDRERLTAMIEQGRFEFWECWGCGEPCAHAVPEDWGFFQGVRQQDYVSYPGNTEVYTPEAIRCLCDTCRSRVANLPVIHDGRP